MPLLVLFFIAAEKLPAVSLQRSHLTGGSVQQVRESQFPLFSLYRGEEDVRDGRASLHSLLFVRFEAAKLVMQWLCNHEDQNMQRMAVAIISILAAKV